MLNEDNLGLQQSLTLLRATLESSTSGILVTDLDQKIIDYNSAFLKIFSSITVRKNAFVHDLTAALENPDQFLNLIDKIKVHPHILEHAIFKLNKTLIVECSAAPYNLQGQIIGYVWNFHDITKQTHLQEKLFQQALHDPLTQLPNRILLQDRLDAAIHNAKRNGTLLAVLFLDLDRFKLINDSFSHYIGDELLKAVTLRIKGNLREQDTLARLGGDELVILIPDLKKENYAITVAQKIVHAFNTPFQISAHSVSISTSIGISLYPQDGNTPEELIKKSDLAMYQAKKQGGNQFKFYIQSLNEDTEKRFNEENELRNAIQQDEFFLMYQPQMHIATHQMDSVEALIRWQHPNKGVILPLDFIPLAEESGLIVPIGELVLNKVCAQINQWQEQSLPLMRVAINITIQQLKQNNFAESVQAILKKHCIPAKYIEMEITENVILAHKTVLIMIKKLKKIGVNIVLDDFGMTNSTLNYLTPLYFNRLKIDRTFIKKIENANAHHTLIETIIKMARGLKFDVIAEGVETEKQIHFLMNQHCDEIQGYYLSKPLTSTEIINFFKKAKY